MVAEVAEGELLVADGKLICQSLVTEENVVEDTTGGTDVCMDAAVVLCSVSLL